MAETIYFIPSSFCLLPSAFFLLPSAFFLLLYNSGELRSEITHKQRFLRKMGTGDQKNQFLDHKSRLLGKTRSKKPGLLYPKSKP
ncbi:hypothetical protein [Microcoleus sp. B9-D4]|uniref:hypothetical protein n=1 Tax=Microcoleus sp. B9-D4 TaxID=2818711 RepID=UPI002FD6691A